MTRNSDPEGKRRDTYHLFLFHETPRAFLVGRKAGDRETSAAFWVPKSQVSEFLETNIGGFRKCEISIPRWLAEEKGLDPSRDADVLEED